MNGTWFRYISIIIIDYYDYYSQFSPKLCPCLLVLPGPSHRFSCCRIGFAVIRLLGMDQVNPLILWFRSWKKMTKSVGLWVRIKVSVEALFVHKRPSIFLVISCLSCPVPIFRWGLRFFDGYWEYSILIIFCPKFKHESSLKLIFLDQTAPVKDR